MTTEATPLKSADSTSSSSGTFTKSSVMENISNKVKKVVTPENVEMVKERAAVAGQYASDRVSKLKALAQDGELSLRGLALICGAAMVVTGGAGLFYRIIHLEFIRALIQFYTMLLGLLVIILEGPELDIETKYEADIRKYALFLDFVWGRGLLYFVAGTLQMSQLGFWDVLTGAATSAVGILFFVVGRSTAKKLAALKATTSEEALQSKFAEHDTEKVGSLTRPQFAELMKNCGLEMNKRETETLFRQLDVSNDGRLQWEEFKTWIDSWEHIDTPERAQFALKV